MTTKVVERRELPRIMGLRGDVVPVLPTRKHLGAFSLSPSLSGLLLHPEIVRNNL